MRYFLNRSAFFMALSFLACMGVSPIEAPTPLPARLTPAKQVGIKNSESVQSHEETPFKGITLGKVFAGVLALGVLTTAGLRVYKNKELQQQRLKEEEAKAKQDRELQQQRLKEEETKAKQEMFSYEKVLERDSVDKRLAKRDQYRVDPIKMSLLNPSTYEHLKNLCNGDVNIGFERFQHRNEEDWIHKPQASLAKLVYLAESEWYTFMQEAVKQRGVMQPWEKQQLEYIQFVLDVFPLIVFSYQNYKITCTLSSPL